jgi:hypothetical protein
MSGAPRRGRRLKQKKRGWRVDNPHDQGNVPGTRIHNLYEAWNKPEKAEEWRAKMTQIEAVQD